LAGIILGLSSLTHGLVVTFLPLAILWTIAILLKSKLSLVRIGSFCLYLVVGFLLVISVTLTRNLILGKDLVFISSNAGINFFIGNNPHYDRTTSIRPGIEWEELLERPIQFGFQKPSEKSSFFFRRSFSFITGRPLSYLKLLFRKFLLTLDGYEIKRNQDPYIFRNFSFPLRLLLWKWVVYFPFGVLLPLSLTGMLLFWKERSQSKRKDPRPLLILYFLFSHVVALLFFFICARYRLPLVPFLIIFAGFALCRFYEKLRRRKDREILFIVPMFFVFLFLSNVSHHELTAKDRAEEHYNLGMVYGREGKFDQAIQEYVQALEFQPDHVMAHFNMAVLYQKEKRIDKAIDEYQRAIELFPRGARPYYNLGLIYEKSGDLKKAEDLYIKASQFNPLLPDPLYHLGIVYSKVGKYPQAVEKFEACLKLDPAYYKAYNGMGDLYYRLGQTDRAIGYFKKALDLQPDYAAAHNNLGTAYIKKGLQKEALTEFLKAIKANPDYGTAHMNLGNWYFEQDNPQEAKTAYQRAARLMPHNPTAHYYLALAHLKLGSEDKGMAELNRALSVDSSFLPARVLLEKIKEQ